MHVFRVHRLLFFFVSPLHDRGSLHALPLNNPISRDRVQRCDARALMTLVIDASRVGCDASIRETHRRACYFPRFHRVRANYRLPSAGLNKTSHRSHRLRNDPSISFPSWKGGGGQDFYSYSIKIFVHRPPARIFSRIYHYFNVYTVHRNLLI